MGLRAYALTALLTLCCTGSLHAQAEREESATRRIVFLLPALDPPALAQLREALLAQSAILDAQLILVEEPLELQDAGVRERTDAARSAARERGAALALFLELAGEDRWLVHVLDIEQERVVIRRIEVREAQRSAAIEAVAVLTREASRAIFAGEEPAPVEQPEPAQEPTAEPPAEPEPAAPPAKPAPPKPIATEGVRLSLAYQGTDFAPQTSFGHGVMLSARLPILRTFYAGAGASWVQPEQPPDSGLSVQRIPLHLHAGLRIAPWLRNLLLDLELLATLEFLQRTARFNLQPRQTVSPDRTRIIASVGPRLRAELKPLTFLGFFAGVGLDFVLTRLRYEGRDMASRTIVFLQPNRIRPSIELGVAFYP